MDKPISISINETKNTIIQALNDSKLPPCILLEILNSVSSQMSMLSKQELEFDTKNYIEALKDERDNTEKEE